MQFEAAVRRLDIAGTTESTKAEDKTRIVSEVGSEDMFEGLDHRLLIILTATGRHLSRLLFPNRKANSRLPFS